MLRKLVATAGQFSAVAFLLFVLLFANGVWQAFPGFLSSIIKEITTVLRDPETQWMVFVCLAIYFTAFLFLRFRGANRPTERRKGTNPLWWLGGLVLISTVLHVYCPSSSIPGLTLLAGTVIGQAFAFCGNLKNTNQSPVAACRFRLLPVFVLMLLLASASLWNTDINHIFEYQGRTRWSGPWDNPNIFGLLMGTGAALALGIGVWYLGSVGKKSRVWKYVCVFWCIFAAMLMVRGLFHSYSRGAWIATICGLGYLACSRLLFLSSGSSQITNQATNRYPLLNSVIRWLRKNLLPLVLVMVAIGTLCFWHFHQTNWHPARRAFSAVNTVDFSWRNRIAAWEGALQITAERPWLGAGWNQPEPLYEHYGSVAEFVGKKGFSSEAS